MKPETERIIISTEIMFCEIFQLSTAMYMKAPHKTPARNNCRIVLFILFFMTSSAAFLILGLTTLEKTPSELPKSKELGLPASQTATCETLTHHGCDEL